MGFKSVYRCLQDVFPQIDARILKAVAIEHSKDADAAVNDVITDVLPYLKRDSVTPTNSPGYQNGSGLSNLIEETHPSPYSEQGCTSGVTSDKANDTNNSFCADPQLHDEAENEPQFPYVSVPGDSNSQLSGSTASEEEHTSDVNNHLSGSAPSEEKHSSDDNNQLIGSAPECDGSLLDVESSVAQLVAPFVQEQTQDVRECDVQSEFCSLLPVADCEKSQASNSSDHTSKTDYIVTEMEDIEDELSRNSIVTRSGHLCRTDILEEIIEDAKSNKRSLFTAMESVINMMREVELQEKAAEQAKEEAAKGGLDILVKVEELKQMLAQAKEANDMHAGEVYGERAILATELKELQSRLLGLSDERDKSLATLDEIHHTLEARLAAAEEVRKAAELEKLEKEESAKNALAEQEAIMKKVVQESKLLQQEAEENAKLREFLMKRGRIVDMLQGEISVICLDVSLLKEKFDERVPLSQSLSSSQTSCILASSGSSLKFTAPGLVLDHEQSSKNLDKVNLDSLINDPSPRSQLGEDKVISNDRELLEDEWDIFDKDVELDG
nr:paramyosin isoform X1 [Ziziphus jujuba var. spinosa]